MKRQFLGRLLSLFLVGTVVAGVGCKDYDDDITSLNNRIDELTTGQIASVEKQMQSLQNAVDRLDGVDSGLKDEIEALQGKAETQAGEIGKLQEELGKAASASEVEALKKQIETLESDRGKLEKRIEALESARTSLQDEIDAVKGSDIAVGAQNCAAEAKGAYTGEVAASMIAALGCEYVILGHSERRQYYGETSETLNKKMAQAYANGLKPIYCVGENLAEREAGKHFDVVKAQIEEVVFNLTPEQFSQLVIAYEPVWAIGTGKTATADQAEEIHAYIRKVLAEKFGAAAAECPILYGGSCKPSNAAEIFAKEDVDGGLIGGAALKAEDFLAIGKGFQK